ncbi:hypothetical protein [Pseudonocardia endophytica]|uniref:DUF4386 family protein n=1 Tax=Pseudonocardia endophytica TaxID=401976 RepID=A0A4R1HZF0_PSEEN|nr:hypothetical protein [Pseudonocardia endophytica]TCK26951.1 hypothetical protein EV378_2797 [Pseudonocardia endophytica]
MIASTDAPVSTRPRAALVALFGLLVVALVARLVFTLTEPPFDGGLSYDVLRALGPAYWTLNLYLGGPGYLVSFVATAIFLVVLSRASVLGIVGGVVTSLGGTVFSLAITAEALPYAYAIDPARFGDAEGRALVDAWNADPAGLVAPIVGGQIAIALGVVIGLVAVFLARTTPRWFPVVVIAYALVTQLVPLPDVLVIPDYVVQLVLLGAIGWFGLRAPRS